MSNDARLSTGLPGHPKTKKLIRRLGPAAGWHLVCLILWARDNRPDGDLAGMTGEDIELAAGWTGELDAFANELLAVGFLDGREGAYQLHDWSDHQPWATGSDMRSAKARWNAVKRHHGKAEADRQVPEWAEHVRAASNAASKESDAASNARSTDAAQENTPPSNAPSPSPSPLPSPRAEKLTLSNDRVVAGKPAPPVCPHSEIVALYHEILPEMTRVRDWTEDRQALLRTRWREKPERQSLDWWRKYFEYVRTCPFLMGQGATTGDRPPFFADLEWLVRPRNFHKVVEGKYQRRAA